MVHDENGIVYVEVCFIKPFYNAVDFSIKEKITS